MVKLSPVANFPGISAASDITRIIHPVPYPHMCYLKIDIHARAKDLTKLLEIHRKDYQVPDLLTGMCTCMGEAISTNQEAISNWLFSPNKRSKLFYSLPRLFQVESLVELKSLH